MNDARLQRFTAFTTHPNGGNPAGVWIGDVLPNPGAMQRLAAQLGDSETAFAAPLASHGHYQVRYFGPRAEIPFCGHATIAVAVALGQPDTRHLSFATPAGIVPIELSVVDGFPAATFTSIQPTHEPAPRHLLERNLELFGWTSVDLDPTIPPAIGDAGARHLILATASRHLLTELSYPFDDLQRLSDHYQLATFQVVHRETPALIHSRNPFPSGGVVEDPATGAAAAALAGYIRDLEPASHPQRLTIRQGDDIGRPSRIHVHLPPIGGIPVTGHATRLPDPQRAGR